MQLAFIGLGAMGAPMARHLQSRGHSVTVWNRTRSTAEDWAKAHGGSVADTPRTAAEGAEAVFVCVGNDDSVRGVVLGADGALAGLQPGAVLVDHTTASAALARELGAVCATAGVGFVDAPVSGGQSGAENGTLTIMCGGEAAVLEAVRPALECYGRTIGLMGPVGSGQLAKAVNQICLAGLIQGLAEGLRFAERAGLDGEAVLAAIGKGAAQSWQMDNRGSTMLQRKFDFGFAMDWVHKDLGIALEEAASNGAALPVTELVRSYVAELRAAGGGRKDFSSLIENLP